MLVIGSRALKQHFLNPNWRKFNEDLDLMCTFKEMQNFCTMYSLKPKELKEYVWNVQTPVWGQVEFELTEKSESAKEYINVCNASSFDLNYAPIEVLYSIKRSHRHYPRAFDKHILDYCNLRKAVNYTDTLEYITKIREAETEKREGKLKTPSLNKKTSEFFDDSVSNQVFVHDDIHRIMAHKPLPMYEYIKVNTNKVICSKEKFNALLPEEKIWCVLEEAYVIALERAIIPMMYQGKALATSERAFKWALMRICTTLTSGWFREFATDNYLTILEQHDIMFVQHFLKAVDDGRIKRQE